MLEFDYCIVRDEHDAKIKYVPTIPKELNDLVCIEGKNDLGKSTLLNILALSFYGLKNKRIPLVLRRKMKDILGDEDQTLTFNINITNKKNDLQIIATKKNPNSPEISIYEVSKGKKTYLTPERIESEYEFIYDIPVDPTERIKTLTHDLEEMHNSVGHKISDLRMRVREMITEIGKSRDPKQIIEYQKAIETFGKQLADTERNKMERENDLKFLKKYMYCKYYVEYQEKCKEVETKIKGLKYKKRLDKKEKKTREVEDQQIIDNAKEIIKILSDNIREARYLLKRLVDKKDANILSVWERMDLKSVLLDPEDDDLLIRGVIELRKSLQDLAKKVDSGQKIDEANLYDELIKILRHYCNVKVVIPGIEKTIPELLKILESKNREYQELKAKNDNIKIALQLLKGIEDKRCEFAKGYSSKLKKMLYKDKKEDKSEEDDLDDIENEFRKLEEDLEKNEKMKLHYKECCIKEDVQEPENKASDILEELGKIQHLAPYRSLGEQQISKRITEFTKELCDMNDQITTLRYRKKHCEEELGKLEKQEPHKYQDYRDELSNIFDKMQGLEQKILHEFIENLDKLTKENISEKELSAEQRKYYDSVALYLGRQVGFIRHGDEELEVAKIDLITNRIHTVSKKNIKLTVLGTGHGQGAYLGALLNSIDVKKKAIVLMDEIAMMDNETMRPIYEKLIKLYENGTLLTGIVVQRAQITKVTPISELLK